jgi:glycosyltransferase involved in cell wall biosynthesis
VPLRVLHLSTYAANGGAARAASALDSALRASGIDSRLVTAHGTKFRLARGLDRKLWHLQRSPTATWRSPARFGSLTAAQINAASADVVNLHWVTDGFLSIEQIGKITKPIVWSMYDMWPFCGTEHYGVDSTQARWRTGYTRDNRPTGETGLDIDRWSWERKASKWAPKHMVPASSWLEASVHASALMGEWPVTRIPHVVNTDTFSPMDQREARHLCGLPESGPLLLFLASAGIFDLRKGFDLLEQALAQVRLENPGVHVVVAGPPAPDYTSPSGVPILWQGNIEGDEKLRALYCSTDLLVVPSREDNMPLTAMEGQSCGVPVVAFDIGGMSDIVVNGDTGALVSRGNTPELGAAISHLLKDEPSRRRMSSLSVLHARETWSPAVVAGRYQDIYAAMLD